MKSLSLRTALLLLTSIMVAGLSFAQSDKEKAAFQKAVASARNMKSMTSDFKETKHLNMLNDDVVSTGKLWYQAPSCMRWEYDTKNYGVYNQKGGYMVKNGVRDGALSRGFSNMGKMVTGLLSTLSEDQKDFSISYCLEGNELVVTATPKSARLKGVIDGVVMKFDAQSSIKSFEIRTNAGYTLITFSFVKINPEIDKQLFN